MNKNSTIHPITNRSLASLADENLLNGLKTNKPAFSRLYDQYASVLLGVIIRIVDDKDEATTLLEVTFKKVHNQINEFQAKKQPLFVWLLKIARCTALDTLDERKATKSFIPRLTTSSQIVTSAAPIDPTAIPAGTRANMVDSQLKELLDKVLFENFSPEDAASSLGMPATSVRQQLRLAMHQLRASQKA